LTLRPSPAKRGFSPEEREMDMPEATYDVLTLGNAIVDVIARAEETFLHDHALTKGAMRLIDEATAERLFAAMGPATIMSGGSAANTAAGVAGFGGRAAFQGKIRADAVGDIFRHDIGAIGVHFPTPAATDGPSTARCFVLVTPDGERTMNTYLGACQTFSPSDVDRPTVEASRIVYLEGYLWDPPAAKEAFRAAADIAHAAGREVALTLSDSFCVDRYRAEFLALLRTATVDLVFANEHELRSLYMTADNDTAIAAIRKDARAAVITRSEKGAVYVQRDFTATAEAFPIRELVDTTGAGDLFAAGFLHGRAKGREPADCLKFGALAAAEVIQQIGARPAASLRQRAIDDGLRP
jgi:sugar/nucleoside kinase (ribokinase family)